MASLGYSLSGIVYSYEVGGRFSDPGRQGRAEQLFTRYQRLCDPTAPRSAFCPYGLLNTQASKYYTDPNHQKHMDTWVTAEG